MPRRTRAYVKGTALALALSGLLAGCTGSSDDEGTEDTKPDATSPSQTAEPGKYRTLPEPCGAVSTNTLKDMLPGTTGGESGTASPYEGERAVTYDTDRRVGCKWKSSTTLSTRHLSIDLERVVSYDPDVSDDEKAEELFDEKSEAAGIPASPPSDSEDGDSNGDGDGDGSEDSGESGESGDQEDQGGETDGASDKPSSEDSPSEGGSDSAEDGEAGKSANSGDKSLEPGQSGSSGSPSDSPSESGSPSSPSDDESVDDAPTPTGSLAPRPLDSFGDTAYISDALNTADSGVHRDITVVFRTANVIATVEYDQWVTDKRNIPDSEELQEQAQNLATELAKQFEDD